MTWIGTKSTRQPASRNASSISDSTSKRQARQGSAAQIFKSTKRKPHWVSGKFLPTRREICRLIQRLACRRNQGMERASCIRLPMTSAAEVVSAFCKKTGISSGRCCPSPSRSTAQSNPFCIAVVRPVFTAAPLPKFRGWETTMAPAFAASWAVLSLDPSSTTTTFGI